MSGSNLLVIMSDEHQARALGCAGHPVVRTPNLDRLAESGVRFANAYTPSPICVPARAAFATGRFVHETRLWDNAMPYTGAIPSWGHALQAKGVAVESIGKLHYRAQEDPAGFDVEHLPMMVSGGVGMVWASIRKEDERVYPPARMLGEYIGPGTSNYIDYDRSVTARTVEWLSRRRSAGSQPWCLFVGLVAPHFPLVAPPEFFDLYPAHSIPPAKLHPREGYRRHPWVEKQNAQMDSESRFDSEEERLRAMSAYFGLCTWLDHNVGQILDALAVSGLGGDTTVVYTSDHGDNVGARGLWGKSNLYQESVCVPLIVAGPGLRRAVCETPVSLLDLSVEIAEHFGASIESASGAKRLRDIACEPDDLSRTVFSEYHAVGAVSGAYMIRKGRWKYHHYVGFEPELFDVVSDHEEIEDLAALPDFEPVRAMMERELRRICDPEEVNAQAFADQADLVRRHGGREAAISMGAPGATPPP